MAKMKKYHLKGIAALLITGVLFLGLCPAAAALSFPDVPRSEWYAEYVLTLTELGMLCGYSDQTFRPEQTLTRGEFLKLVDKCLGGNVPQVSGPGWAKGYLADLIDRGVVLPFEIEDSEESLNAQITRYEMAVMLVRASDLFDNAVADVSSARYTLTDYSEVPAHYKYYVLQAYARGLLNGYTDGCFDGDRCLSRAEVAAVITRLIFPDTRIIPQQGLIYTDADGLPMLSAWQTTDWQEVIAQVEASNEELTQEYPGSGEQAGADIPEPLPAAGDFSPVNDAVGFLSVEQQRQLLFGDSSKTCFDSDEEARAHMTEVEVPIWTKGSDGTKRASTMTLVVNRALQRDVEGIFNLIFKGPERYCIVSAGGYSWTSSLRSEHNWGSAIDINPFANPYINSAGAILVGEYYDPLDEYSLTSSSDVVRAFAAYGWGWAGEGKWSSGALDYMHLSLMGT